MTSIPSNLGPAVTLGQDAIKPSRQTAEERQLFEEARIRGENKAAREEAETQEIIDSTKDRTLVLSHAEFPHTSDPERLLTPTERYERTSESQAQAVTMMLNDLPQATERANDALSRLEQEIFNDRPHLQHQEWDFSINANDTLELVNSDELSTSDSRYLTEKLNGSGLPHLYSDLRDTMIRILDAERGVENYSTSIGKYDLTEDNYSDIIRFREFSKNTPSGMVDGKLQIVEFTSAMELSRQLEARSQEEYSEVRIINEYI